MAPAGRVPRSFGVKLDDVTRRSKSALIFLLFSPALGILVLWVFSVPSGQALSHVSSTGYEVLISSAGSVQVEFGGWSKCPSTVAPGWHRGRSNDVGPDWPIPGDPSNVWAVEWFDCGTWGRREVVIPAGGGKTLRRPSQYAVRLPHPVAAVVLTVPTVVVAVALPRRRRRAQLVQVTAGHP